MILQKNTSKMHNDSNLTRLIFFLYSNDTGLLIGTCSCSQYMVEGQTCGRTIANTK